MPENRYKPSNYGQNPARNNTNNVQQPVQPIREGGTPRQAPPVPPNRNQANRPTNTPQPQIMEDRGYYEDNQPMSKTPAPKVRTGNLKSKIIAGGVVVALLAACGIGLTIKSQKSKTSEQTPFAGTNLSQQANTNALTSNATGDTPTNVGWPSDITPTRMEIQLNPKTGEPTLILIGERSGVGTIVRSYDNSGSLTGYWAITSSSPAFANSSTTNSQPANTANNTTEIQPNLLSENNQTQQNTTEQTQPNSVDASTQNSSTLTNTPEASKTTSTTLTKEQTISNDVHTIIQGKIENKTNEQLVEEYGAKLSAVAEKYQLTTAEVVNIYVTELKKLLGE